jgi:hypothetical protein
VCDARGSRHEEITFSVHISSKAVWHTFSNPQTAQHRVRTPQDTVRFRAFLSKKSCFATVPHSFDLIGWECVHAEVSSLSRVWRAAAYACRAVGCAETMSRHTSHTGRIFNLVRSTVHVFSVQAKQHNAHTSCLVYTRVILSIILIVLSLSTAGED